MSLVTTPAILLRSHPYSDSSRILRFLTREQGIVSLVGKGIRDRTSRGEIALETFAEGVVTFSLRTDRDLHTLRGFDRTSGPLGLALELPRFVGASLLGELLLAHALEGADPTLYDWFRDVLDRLGTAATADVAGWILAGAWRTLSHLGFTPGLGACVTCGAQPSWLALETPGPEEQDLLYRLDAVGGGIRCPDCSRGVDLPRIGPQAHSALVKFVRGEVPAMFRGARGHLRFLEAFSTHHLSPSRPFQSFALLSPVLEDVGSGSEAP